MKGNTCPSVLGALLLLDALSRMGTIVCPSFPKILVGCYLWSNYGLIKLSIKMRLNQARAPTCKEMDIAHLYFRVVCTNKLGGPDTSIQVNVLLYLCLKSIKHISTCHYKEQHLHVLSGSDFDLKSVAKECRSANTRWK